MSILELFRQAGWIVVFVALAFVLAIIYMYHLLRNDPTSRR